MADMEEGGGKRLQITEKLQKREEDRLHSIQQRKTVKKDETETADYLLNQLSVIHSNVEKGLSNYHADTHGAPGNYFDSLIVELQKSQKLLTDSARLLSSYQLEKAQATINQLKTAVEDKRSKIEPMKKFAFKSDKKKAAVQTMPETAAGSSSDMVNTMPSVDQPEQQLILESECGYTKHDNELLTLSSTDVEKKDVVLSSLTGCRVIIQGSPSTVHIASIRDCIILCGPTSGSVFIDNCQKSFVVVACHQLRVHRTTSTSFYLHVTSRAIIEDCSSVQFAPYNWMYTNLEEDFQKAGLDPTRNNWNAVDDFNWLAADKQSPNWSLMDKDARISSWSENGTPIS